MKILYVLCVVLAVAITWIRFSYAQDYEASGGSSDIEYQSAFGEEQGQPASTGAATIEEARRTGRGYRIGGGGLYARSASDVYTVREGDTLWDISQRFYGDPWSWPKLWSYNPEVTNPHWIFPLDQIRLAPSIQMRQAELAGKPGALALTPVSPQGLRLTAVGLENRLPSEKVKLGTLASGTVYLRDMGYLDKEALQTVGQIAASREERRMLENQDLVYIKFKPGQQVKVGQPYSIFRTMTRDERSPKEQGTLVRILGTVSITSYEPEQHLARGIVEETLDPIERGCQVAVVDRRFDLVPPKPTNRELAVKIIATMRPREMISFYDVVFVDAGADKGVEAGNRFFVTRRGDLWRESLSRSPEDMGAVVSPPAYKRSDYPKEIVAELRVVKVRKNTSIALVTSSDVDLELGDVAQTIKGL